MRSADADLLCLALMDARNHSLNLFGQCQSALASSFGGISSLAGPLQLLGHIGWFQERWTGRNVQRGLGFLCDPTSAKLASIEPLADIWWSDDPHDTNVAPLPDPSQTRAYLLESLESTLELLEKTRFVATNPDQALYFYRLSLFHEDMQSEAMVCMAQALGLALEPAWQRVFTPPSVALRDALLVPAARWRMGGALPDGFAFDNELVGHTLDVPEFEIDAQPVSWSQYVEFVADGGYDRPELWHSAGWTWLQGLHVDHDQAPSQGRRGPRYVEQISALSGAVLQTRFGRSVRMSGNQPAMHMSWWEAEAWCRWAGRRLPMECEWELAAHSASRRGFRWGDVWEWTANSFQPYPGFVAGPQADYSQPFFGTHKVLRGASFATRARMKNPCFRRFELPSSDSLFCGFRSCAV
jgi:ergothioneine biosynthesis protein EgtB